MATAGKRTRNNKLQQGSKHGNHNMPPRLIGRDLALRPALQISGLDCTHEICVIPTEASNLHTETDGARANKAIAALNRIAMSGAHANTRCAREIK